MLLANNKTRQDNYALIVKINKTQEEITTKTHLQQELHRNLHSGRFSILLKSHHYLPIILDSYQSIKKRKVILFTENRSSNLGDFRASC